MRTGQLCGATALVAAMPLAGRAQLQFESVASVLRPAGPAALAIADIAWAMFVGAALVLAGVTALLLVAVRRGPSTVQPKRWLLGAGVAFPVTVLVALSVFSQWRSAALRADPPADALVISVTGRMWWWEVRYRNPAGGGDIVLANEIRIPVGRPVHLGLTTADVIHSVWFPALAGKMDTVPGRVNHLVFSASAAGVHRGQCAEFCGEQHARMGMHLVAEPPEVFDAWLRAQAEPAVAPATPLQERGRQAFLAQRCGACHTVRGVSEEGRLAPDLTHVGSRVALGAGVLQNHEKAMAQWIAHVQRLKPGARMPGNEDLDTATLQALAAYLSHLQ
jgi:cytochrome c oxidase subunit 2